MIASCYSANKVAKGGMICGIFIDMFYYIWQAIKKITWK